MTTSLVVQEDNIKNLWQLDALGICDPIETKSRKQHESEVHENLIKSIIMNKEGRYEVQIPWLDNHPVLESNYQLAVKRLEFTAKSIKTNGLFSDYDKVFQEWKQESIIEEVSAEEVKNWGHYLPHRPVIKENSTTRIRPVFDASAKQNRSPSLNPCVEKGPNLIEKIPDLLVRFREGKIGIISDIKKAFLQINIAEKDRNYLRFLWFNKKGEIVVLRHMRVVFGLSCSPFILGAVIDYHLKNILNNNPNLILLNSKIKEISVKLSKSFYVDNCITSVNSKVELSEFISVAKTLMGKGSFNLRGWEHTRDESDTDQAAVLGILWNKRDDTLLINVPDTSKLFCGKITKRSILSLSHKIFDPLGIVCPVTLLPKMLLREMCSTKMLWDDEVSSDISDRFCQWVKELPELAKVSIPSCMIGIINDSTKITLHTFGDASQLSYATVVFIRIEDATGVHVNFVEAKSRIAPVQKASTPRLELLAATISARLGSSILESLEIVGIESYFWSDSSTVLAWIKRQNQWSRFVWNRVQEIRRLTDYNCWRHVPGISNPADLPSRGCSSRELLKSKWWEGPSWLKWPKNEWPQEILYDEVEINKEKVKAVDSLTMLTVKNVSSSADDCWYSKNFNNFDKLLIFIAWSKRFLYNSRIKKKDKNSRKRGNLTVDEISASEVCLLKLVQLNFIGKNDSHFEHLNVFIDDQKLFRLKTKVFMRNDTFNFRCPILLPGNHHVVHLLIEKMHLDLCHAGVQILMSNIRERFWILGGRRTIRSIIRKCVTCNRHDSKSIKVDEPPLPLDRVRDATVFEVTGIDFAGPVYLRDKSKAWICIFTCAVFRAVHIELVSSLSTPSFLEAFRRFIARRGRPSKIYTDNGKNFVGMGNLLDSINWDQIIKTSSIQKISWHFNPPTAAWWGGFWERLIGVLKRLLKRVLKRACLSYEEMYTVLCDCEAVINSRPITFMSDNVQDLIPLTPSMFLQEIKDVGVVDLDKIENCDLNKRFAYRQKIKDELRKRFRVEYLGELVKFNNKNTQCDSKKLNAGDVVTIGCDNLKRLEWPLACVQELIVGKDGKIRVAKLVTADGILTRAVQRIFPLEIKTQLDQSIIEKNFEKRDIKLNKSEIIPELKVDEIVEPEIVTKSGRVIKKPDRYSK